MPDLNELTPDNRVLLEYLQARLPDVTRITARALFDEADEKMYACKKANARRTGHGLICSQIPKTVFAVEF